MSARTEVSQGFPAMPGKGAVKEKTEMGESTVEKKTVQRRKPEKVLRSMALSKGVWLTPFWMPSGQRGRSRKI